MRLIFFFIAFWIGNVHSLERFTLERTNSASPLVYYFSTPDTQSYPILVLCDGSEVQGDVRSILFVRGFFEKKVEELNVGYLTIEKWGVDGDVIDQSFEWIKGELAKWK